MLHDCTTNDMFFVQVQTSYDIDVHMHVLIYFYIFLPQAYLIWIAANVKVLISDW